MLIINLPRGYSKTSRAIYLSEITKAPILVTNRITKAIIQNKARTELKATIPDPVLISELEGNTFPNGLIVDEAINVLLSFIKEQTNSTTEVKALTLTAPNESIDKPINDIKDNLIGVQEMVQELPDCEIGKLSETCNFIANKIKNIRYELERLKMV